MKPAIRLSFRDEGHQRAHAGDFSVPLDLAIEWARSRLGASHRRQGWQHFDFKAPRIAGLSGLRRIWPWTRGDFWAQRRGRAIPSHLIVGKKRPTRRICVWGVWKDDESFVIHTLYPGRAAPREIHDPEIGSDELTAAIRFWSRHAIIVSASEQGA